MDISTTNPWQGASAYREWLLTVHPNWSRILKPGEKKIRQVASGESMQLPVAFEGFFRILNGQRSQKQNPIPFMPTFGLTLLDVSSVARRRDNELGTSHLIRELPYNLEYLCESGVREGLWRKAWYPFAESHIDFGSHLLFVDFDPQSTSSAGQVVLQSRWLGWSSGWCQRLVLCDGLDGFFARLAEAGRQGQLVYREPLGIDLMDRSNEELCRLLGIDRVKRMPPEAECKP